MASAKQSQASDEKTSRKGAQYTIVKPLGHGKFGTVFKVIRDTDNAQFALKIINVGGDDGRLCLNEVAVFSKLPKHENIIAFHEYFIEGVELCLVLELAEQGDLATQIELHRSSGRPFEEYNIWKYVYFISSALAHMHQYRTCHRDVKPANCYLTQEGVLKLGDMGFGKILQEFEYAQSLVGTPLYWAPEILREREYDEKADVWSLGCVMYELAMLNAPFPGDRVSFVDFLNHVLQGVFEPVSDKYSKPFRELVNSMLQVHKDNRPSADEVRDTCFNWIMKQKQRRMSDVDDPNQPDELTDSHRSMESVESAAPVPNDAPSPNAKPMTSKSTNKPLSPVVSAVSLNDEVSPPLSPLAVPSRQPAATMLPPLPSAGAAASLVPSAIQIPVYSHPPLSPSTPTSFPYSPVPSSPATALAMVTAELHIHPPPTPTMAVPMASRHLHLPILSEEEANDVSWTTPNSISPSSTVRHNTPAVSVRATPAAGASPRTASDSIVTMTFSSQYDHFSNGEFLSRRNSSSSDLDQPLALQRGPSLKRHREPAANAHPGTEGRSRSTRRQSVPVGFREHTNGDYRDSFDSSPGSPTQRARDFQFGDRFEDDDEFESSSDPLATASPSITNGLSSLMISNPNHPSHSHLLTFALPPAQRSGSSSSDNSMNTTTSGSSRSHSQSSSNATSPRGGSAAVSPRTDSRPPSVSPAPIPMPPSASGRGFLGPDFESLGVIGIGKHSEVHKARHMQTNKLVAVKKLHAFDLDAKARNECQNEATQLSGLPANPNLIRYLGSYMLLNDLFLVLELAEDGDLAKFLDLRKQCGQRLSEAEIWFFFSQMCEGLRVMHANRVMHRDIKPANMFLSGAHRTLKLGDLGLAKYMSSAEGETYSVVGTPLYMSPEALLNERGYDFKSDIWSLGCVLFELAALSSPFAFEPLNVFTLANNIKQAKFNPLPPNYSRVFEDLVLSMLRVDPKDRPDIETVAQIAKHECLCYSPRTPHPSLLSQPLSATTSPSGKSRHQHFFNTTAARYDGLQSAVRGSAIGGYDRNRGSTSSAPAQVGALARGGSSMLVTSVMGAVSSPVVAKDSRRSLIVGLTPSHSEESLGPLSPAPSEGMSVCSSPPALSPSTSINQSSPLFSPQTLQAMQSPASYTLSPPSKPARVTDGRSVAGSDPRRKGRRLSNESQVPRGYATPSPPPSGPFSPYGTTTAAAAMYSVNQTVPMLSPVSRVPTPPTILRQPRHHHSSSPVHSQFAVTASVTYAPPMSTPIMFDNTSGTPHFGPSQRPAIVYPGPVYATTPPSPVAHTSAVFVQQATAAAGGHASSIQSSSNVHRPQSTPTNANAIPTTPSSRSSALQ